MEGGGGLEAEGKKADPGTWCFLLCGCLQFCAAAGLPIVWPCQTDLSSGHCSPVWPEGKWQVSPAGEYPRTISCIWLFPGNRAYSFWQFCEQLFEYSLTGADVFFGRPAFRSTTLIFLPLLKHKSAFLSRKINAAGKFLETNVYKKPCIQKTGVPKLPFLEDMDLKIAFFSARTCPQGKFIFASKVISEKN